MTGIAAAEAGLRIIRCSPPCGGGIKLLEAIAALPRVALLATSGIDLTESVRAWITAGWACLGMGSAHRQDLLARGDYPEIARRVRQVLGWIQAAQAGRGAD